MMLIWTWIVVLVVGLDQYTKYLTETYLEFQQPVKIFSFLNWFFTYNPGASWGFLRDAGPWKHWFFLSITAFIVILLLVWIYKLKSNEKTEAIAYSLIIGGAIGNVIDRLRIEKVVDFIQFHYQDWYFPTFNIADSAITIGVMLLFIKIYGELRRDWKEWRANNPGNIVKLIRGLRKKSN